MISNPKAASFVLPFSAIGIGDISIVGGKNASLGEMIKSIDSLGVMVPQGFATTSDAYHDFLARNNLVELIESHLSKLRHSDLRQLEESGRAIREAILGAELPKELIEALRRGYADLSLQPGQSVAVRSSATLEDLTDASSAGQQETFLNVQGFENVALAVKKVYASLFTNRAISYRVDKGLNCDQMGISAGVQLMVRSDLASSGVMFTLDTETGFDKVVFLTASYGLGECIVQGEVNPDEFYIHKPTLELGRSSIISRKLGSKKLKMVFSNASRARETTSRVAVEESKQGQFCLSDAQILELSNYALNIEKHFGKPMDIEWAKDGITNQLYIVQARPETVEASKTRTVIEKYELKEESAILSQGRGVGKKIGQGPAKLIATPNEMAQMKAGDVLVTDMTDPDWEPIMKMASAIVTNRGGRTCHAAIIARELGIPAVVGCEDATSKIKDGENITVSCAEGESGFIYKGLLKFEKTRTNVAELPSLPLKLCMNLANPEQAFQYQFIPNEGVGLTRLEFIISNMIGIHPNALLDFDNLPDDLKSEISARISAYSSPTEFYTEKLAEGVSTIAAAFYPKQIIVRLSDFKSNEYANLLGGPDYEPDEENPMIGFRGASRYISKRFRDCFALECEAIKRVRELKGLTNAHVMLPFVRTVTELLELIKELRKNGLEREKAGLKLYMMCEVPSNAILAEQFLEHIDGFSIGSNDLTQLTLGLDRDSALVANLFDERNDAVKVLLKQAISACNKANKYVGICGQGPSDHPDFAGWLMKEGIQSISLSPDSIVATWLSLAKGLKENGLAGKMPQKQKSLAELGGVSSI